METFDALPGGALVAEGLARGLVTALSVREAFAEIEPSLYRYPAIDPAAFKRAVQSAVGAKD